MTNADAIKAEVAASGFRRLCPPGTVVCGEFGCKACWNSWLDREDYGWVSELRADENANPVFWIGRKSPHCLSNFPNEMKPFFKKILREYGDKSLYIEHGARMKNGAPLAGYFGLMSTAIKDYSAFWRRYRAAIDAEYERIKGGEAE